MVALKREKALVKITPDRHATMILVENVLAGLRATNK